MCGVCLCVLCVLCCVCVCVCVPDIVHCADTVGNEKRRERERFCFRDEESLRFVKTSLVPLHLDRYFALVYILILQAGCNQ